MNLGIADARNVLAPQMHTRTWFCSVENNTTGYNNILENVCFVATVWERFSAVSAKKFIKKWFDNAFHEGTWLIAIFEHTWTGESSPKVQTYKYKRVMSRHVKKCEGVVKIPIEVLDCTRRSSVLICTPGYINLLLWILISILTSLYFGSYCTDAVSMSFLQDHVAWRTLEPASWSSWKVSYWFTLVSPCVLYLWARWSGLMGSRMTAFQVSQKKQTNNHHNLKFFSFQIHDLSIYARCSL